MSGAVTGKSYASRAIDVTITLGQGTFGQTGQNTIKLSGLRVECTILKAGFPSMDTAEVRVYGVKPSTMNAISTLGISPIIMERQHNSVSIEAGDNVNGMAVVYQGQIINAWQDFDGAPDTFLHIIGGSGKLAAMQPVAPISFPGGADVATIMAGLATQMGLAFENGGVQVQLANPYFAGTALEQAHAVARAANIEMYVDGGTLPSGTPQAGFGTLAIWPKNKTRGGLVPTISAATGLVGYPRFHGLGMAFRTIFNPNLRVGGQILMQSTIGGAGQPIVNGAGQKTSQAGGPNGYWMIAGPLTYDLASQVPGGPWFCDAVCARTLVPSAP